MRGEGRARTLGGRQGQRSRPLGQKADVAVVQCTRAGFGLPGVSGPCEVFWKFPWGFASAVAGWCSDRELFSQICVAKLKSTVEFG
eukprot:3699073-Rhodomonas_salina.1